MKKINYISILVVFCCISAVSYAEEAAIESEVILQENIKGSTAYEDGILNFQAKKAMYRTDGSQLELREEVKFKTSDGISLETESITWDQETDRVSSNEQVYINKQDPDINIKGRGLEAQTGLKTVTLENDVEVILPQEDSMFIVITCEGSLEVKYEEGLAIFNDEVKVSQKDSELYTDKATVYFDSEKKELDRIVAEGNVRLVRGKDTSYSHKGVYYAKEKRVKLEGRPRLVIFPESGGDDLKSDWSDMLK